MVEQVYRPRRPKKSPLWQCLCAHFYDFIQAYPEKYEKKYGFLKPVVEDVVNNYLDCGDLSKGFARIYCENCKKSMLLPRSWNLVSGSRTRAKDSCRQYFIQLGQNS
jgi:hypothetical protein